MEKNEAKPRNALRRERERRGWSRDYMAEQIGVSSYTYAQWERGKQTPYPHYLQKLCELFEKSPQELDLSSLEEASTSSNQQDLNAHISSFEECSLQFEETDKKVPSWSSKRRRNWLPTFSRDGGGHVPQYQLFAPLRSPSFSRSPFAALLVTLTSLVLLVVLIGHFWFNNTSSIPPGRAMSTTPPPSATDEPVPPFYGVKGRLVLNDPLNNQPTQGQWHLTTENKQTWCRIIEGAYHMREADNEYCLADNPSSLMDFVYQIDMTMLQGPQAGIVFRAIDTQQFFYDFEVGVDGSYRLYRSEPSPDIAHNPIILQGTSPAIQKGYHRLNQLAVKVIGPQISLYVNAHFIGEAQDYKYTSGNIGVRMVVDDGFTIHGQGYSEATYRNAKVWALSVG